MRQRRKVSDPKFVIYLIIALLVVKGQRILADAIVIKVYLKQTHTCIFTNTLETDRILLSSVFENNSFFHPFQVTPTCFVTWAQHRDV